MNDESADINIAMTDAEILELVEPALRRCGFWWAPAPANPRHLHIAPSDIRRLVNRGALRWGNRSRSFVVKACDDD